MIELEAENMIKLGSHPNLVNMIESNKYCCAYRKLDTSNAQKETANAKYVIIKEEINYMILEKCSNGALSKYVKNTGPFEEEVARFLFGQLCSAVHFLHSQEYVHLDLKLDNILCDDHFNLKLADLGIAVCAQNSTGLLNHRRGTSKYMAPEVERATNEAPYNVFKADIYSLGICLHLILLGYYPCVEETDSNSTEEFDMDTEQEKFKKEKFQSENESYLSEE